MIEIAEIVYKHCSMSTSNPDMPIIDATGMIKALEALVTAREKAMREALASIQTISEEALGEWVGINPAYVPEDKQALCKIYSEVGEIEAALKEEQQ